MSTDDDSGNFLARWSRLKRLDPNKPERTPDPASTARPAIDTPDAAAEPPFDITKLPKIEDLTASSDIAAFLRKGVPEELKRLAMRRIWSLDPAIRDFIEVAENQYDWNAVDGVPGFGEIGQGTDIQKLLQQALGQVPDPSPPDLLAEDTGVVADDAANARQTNTENAALQHNPSEAVEPPATDTADTEAPAASPTQPVAGARSPTETDARQASSTALQGPRRRHGGALPSLAEANDAK